jgi:predicted nucleotidyltransferase
MLDVQVRDVLKKTVRTHLPNEAYRVFIFGSRATKASRKFSDIDLGIEGPVPLTSKQYIQLANALDETDIPYKIDLVDFSEVSEKFKIIALQNTINL